MNESEVFQGIFSNCGSILLKVLIKFRRVLMKSRRIMNSSGARKEYKYDKGPTFFRGGSQTLGSGIISYHKNIFKINSWKKELSWI